MAEDERQCKEIMECDCGVGVSILDRLPNHQAQTETHPTTNDLMNFNNLWLLY